MTDTETVRTVREILAGSPEWGPETLDAIAAAVSYDPDTFGTCDHCGGAYVLGADDHNPETGCHFECEGEQQ